MPTEVGRRLLPRQPRQAQVVGELTEPLLWVLLAVAATTLVVALTGAARQILGRQSADRRTRVRRARTTVVAGFVGMLALATMRVLASNA